MGSPPVQTPINILKAGDVGGFSAHCVKALAECGYEPDDFGSYQSVKDRVKTAKEARADYVSACQAAGTTPDPHGPDAHTAMLAQCDVGHLSRNAWFRTSSGKNSGCGNRAPPDAEAGCYSNFAAPAFPALKYQQDTNTEVRNSPANLATKTEAAEAAAAQASAPAGTNPNQLSANQLSSISRKATSVALGNSPGAEPVDPAHQATLNASKAATGAQASSLAVDQAAAGGTLGGTTAEECIEAFRQAAMEEMRNRIAAAHSPPELASTQAAAQARLDAANARAAAASAASPPDPAEVAAAQRDVQTATNNQKQVNCFAAQAARLGNSRPPFTGMIN